MNFHKAACACLETVIANKRGQLMTKTNIDINLDKFNQVDFSPELLNDFLKPDGALRDIYVDNTSIKDWENVIDTFKNSDFSINFFVDENESKLPTVIS
jgi:hypothetical protein